MYTKICTRSRKKIRESMHCSSFPDNHELQVLVMNLRDHINNTGEILVRQLRRKDYLITKCEKLCAIITAHLQARSPKRRKLKHLLYIYIIISPSMLKLCTIISFKNSSRSRSKRESPKHRGKDVRRIIKRLKRNTLYKRARRLILPASVSG